MPFTDKPVALFLSFTERSQTIRTIVYGFTAFVFIFGIDLLWRFGGLSWYWGQLASDVFEATLLALIASHLIRLREERMMRRQREMGYLNHHVRNSLAMIQLVEHQKDDMDQRTTTVQQASRRICKVLEQLSRNEDVSIDEVSPGKYERDRKSA